MEDGENGRDIQQRDTGLGGPGSGPQTGVSGRSQDEGSGVSLTDAAADINPGDQRTAQSIPESGDEE